jgi:murein DD-endopeptidase MepM/ murein hydrolase activator NlpD
MTPTGRQAAIGLIATLLAGTAGCAAYPQYPIEPGHAAGDGGLHMTQRPQYPIGDGRDASRSAYDANPAQGRPAPMVAAPRPSDDDDTPRAVPSAPVDSAPLPDSGRPHLIFGMAEAPPAFELAAYHHRRGPPADESDTPAPLTKAEKAKAEKADKAQARSRHGKAAADEAAPDDAKTAASGDMPLQVTLKPGERLATVAKRLHVSKQALMQVNGISPTDKVLPGSTLKTPYRYAYEVKKGDTLYAIGHRFHMDAEQLAKLNAMKHAAELQPGQTVELPSDVADAGAREHALGDALVPVGAPDKLIASQSRKERQAAEREAAKQARLDRRHGRRATEVAEADTASTPGTTAEPTRASRHRRFAPPPTELSSANAPSATAEAAPEPSRPAPTMAYASPAPITPDATPGYVPPPRSPGSVASEMATESPPRPATSLAAPAARQAASSSYTGAAAAPRTTPSYGAASAPTRVASLNTPTYGSPYGAPSLGRPRPALSTSSGGASNAEVAAAGQGHFVWPLRGAILEPFGDKGPGQRNDGLDIVAQPGESVHAAASGEVVYAGSSIPGFGNLILVKHPGGWVTAYAHLDRIEVRMRDSVTQGQEIGQAGQTGAVDRPQLHFEIRYAPQADQKARPIDPTLVLPGAG